jgi:hypothetical protein
MASKAKLPADEAQAALVDAIDSMEYVVEVLEDLHDDERWRIWNLGGAAFGKPQFKGPGYLTSEQFVEKARLLLKNMRDVHDSFEHRKDYEDQQREKRATRLR